MLWWLDLGAMLPLSDILVLGRSDVAQDTSVNIQISVQDNEGYGCDLEKRRLR